MKNRIVSILLPMLLALVSVTARAAEPLTVVGLTSDAATGVTITFSRELKVTHNMWDVAGFCFTEFYDLDATTATTLINIKTPAVDGCRVTLRPAYVTFVNGHSMHLVLNPDHFVALDGTTKLTGPTTFDFSMGDVATADPFDITSLTPSSDERTHLDNISVTFVSPIVAVVDEAGFSVRNEQGDQLPLIRVEINTETDIKALNIDIDTDNAVYAEATTYRLHIAPGAIRCKAGDNPSEIVVGEWYIKPRDLKLVTTPAAQSMVESLSKITIAALDGGPLTLAPGIAASDFTVTGIMEDQSVVHATGTSITPSASGLAYTITLDRTITPKSVAAAQTLGNNVKINVPAGTFSRGAATNARFQPIWAIAHPVTPGTLTWTIQPASGTTVSRLGKAVEDLEEGTTTYTISLAASGTNAYITMPDASTTRIVDDATGATVMAFDATAFVKTDVNAYDLVMPHQIADNGTYTLIIPATAVNVHSDPDHYSPPVHPVADIEATWTVRGSTTSVATPAAADGCAIYDLSGRRIATSASAPAASRAGIVVTGTGRVVRRATAGMR